MLVAFDFAKS